MLDDRAKIGCRVDALCTDSFLNRRIAAAVVKFSHASVGRASIVRLITSPTSGDPKQLPYDLLRRMKTDSRAVSANERAETHMTTPSSLSPRGVVCSTTCRAGQ